MTGCCTTHGQQPLRGRRAGGALITTSQATEVFDSFGSNLLCLSDTLQEFDTPRRKEVQERLRADVAPRTPIEEAVANIWAEVLHRAQVGAEDNFFDPGGDSLLATQVVSRVREVMGIEWPLRALFEAPTVAQLGRILIIMVSDSREQLNIIES